MIRRIPQNAVLVELEKISEDEYKLSSGVKLYMNTSYKPEQHQRIFGKCVAIPDVLTKDGGMVKWEEGNFKHLDSIAPEVMIGDTVYFNYVAINKMSLLEYDGKSYYKIDYSAIICVAREGKIIPIGGNILCEEYYGKDAQSVDVCGRKVFGEVSGSGIITKIIKAPSQRHATVKITGTPLHDDIIEVEPGDIVMFPNKFGFKNNIEGADYLVLKYWDVSAVVGNVSTGSAI